MVLPGLAIAVLDEALRRSREMDQSQVGEGTGVGKLRQSTAWDGGV